MKTSLLAGTAMAAALTVAPQGGASVSGAAPVAGAPSGARGGAPAGVVLDWEATAMRTIYVEAAAPIPVGTLYLGFSSLAVHSAVRRALEQGARADAAAARAAHDVLV